MLLSVRLFGTAKGRRVNETNALTMPTLITGPDRPPNRWASARANYAALPADDRANRTVSAASRREASRVSCKLALPIQRDFDGDEFHPIDPVASFLFLREQREKEISPRWFNRSEMIQTTRFVAFRAPPSVKVEVTERNFSFFSFFAGNLFSNDSKKKKKKIEWHFYSLKSIFR